MTNDEVIECSFDDYFEPFMKQLAYASTITGEVDDSDCGQNRTAV